MATDTKPEKRPDILRDARRLRDMLARYDEEKRSALINIALADLADAKKNGEA